MRYCQAILWVNCGLFVAFGLGFALAPASLAMFVTGSVPDSSSGLIDMRATYGGMASGLATIVGMCARNERYALLGIRGVLAVMVLLAMTRTIGILVDGSPNRFMVILLLAEVAMALMAFSAQAKIKVNAAR